MDVVGIIKEIPSWVLAFSITSIVGSIVAVILGMGIAFAYRTIRFGTKIKKGDVEIDTTDDTEAK